MNLPITEQTFSSSKPIDELGIKEGIDIMIKEQRGASDAVNEIMLYLIDTVTKITSHLKLSAVSRLIYVGAGTSGRIGIQDGVELYPTFGWPLERLDFIIAGGYKALFKPIENAEDDIEEAEKTFKEKMVNKFDVVFGIAASGNTPFTCKFLELSKKANALTIAISNNPSGKLLEYGKMRLILNTKQEVLAGSTRLKAGTAQKICLNIISTMVMTNLGFVRNGQMSNLVATNNKLKKRKKLIQNELK